MAKNTFVKSETITKADPDTGLIVMTETKKLIKTTLGETEEFFQVYCKLIASVYELSYSNDIKILIKFCEIAEFNTGKVSITSPDRKEICDELNMQSSNMSKSIKRLKDKELISGEKGRYTINPAIFWKGDKKTRAELLKDGGLSVTFNFEL